MASAPLQLRAAGLRGRNKTGLNPEPPRESPPPRKLAAAVGTRGAVGGPPRARPGSAGAQTAQPEGDPRPWEGEEGSVPSASTRPVSDDVSQRAHHRPPSRQCQPSVNMAEPPLTCVCLCPQDSHGKLSDVTQVGHEPRIWCPVWPEGPPCREHWPEVPMLPISLQAQRPRPPASALASHMAQQSAPPSLSHHWPVTWDSSLPHAPCLTWPIT